MKNRQAAEILREFLKAGNNRITPERFDVLDAALGYEGHFGADDLYILMKNQNFIISRATVYKTLELLAQCDLIRKRNFGGTITKYENNFKKQHDHVICLDCGRIVEFNSNKIKEYPDKICDELGFELENYSLNIFARCKNINTCKHYKERKKD
ncbi:MAG: transcriptional repressor [Ignavibacteriaceae bacterium]|nr:transcriptional repressor [Ignavibacteriaceae bacterium]